MDCGKGRLSGGSSVANSSRLFWFRGSRGVTLRSFEYTQLFRVQPGKNKNTPKNQVSGFVSERVTAHLQTAKKGFRHGQKERIPVETKARPAETPVAAGKENQASRRDVPRCHSVSPAIPAALGINGRKTKRRQGLDSPRNFAGSSVAIWIFVEESRVVITHSFQFQTAFPVQIEIQRENRPPSVNVSRRGVGSNVITRLAGKIRLHQIVSVVARTL